MFDLNESNQIEAKHRNSGSELNGLVRMPPYIEPEHIGVLDNAKKSLEEYEDFLMDKLKAELFNYGGGTNPHPEKVREVEFRFYSDPTRQMLLKNLITMKLLCEKPRFLLKTT